MSLVSQPVAGTQPTAGNAGATAAVAVKTPDQKKVEQAKKMQEAMARKRAALEGVIGELKAKYPQGMPEKVQAWITILTPKAQTAGTGGPVVSVVTKLFGDNPQVGAKISFMDAFKKSGKSPSELKWYFKGWTEKGHGTVKSIDAPEGHDKLVEGFFELTSINPKGE